MQDIIDVTDPDEIAKVLGTKDFAPVSCGDGHAVIGEKLGFDVSHIVAATRHIPLCLRGAEHLSGRKRIAELIAATAADTRLYVETEVPRMIAALLTDGHHDVMREFVNPCVNRLIGKTVGLPIEVADDAMISRIFSHNIGVAKRRRMNTELSSLREMILSELPDLTETELGDRIALCILGTDALRGTLACSLHHVFVHGGTKDSDLSQFPRTGVPYIDREVITPSTVEGADHEAGTLLRSRLEVFEEATDPQARNRFFGFGAHLCLGRKISLQIWQQVTKALADTSAKVTVTRYALRKDDVFHIPQTFEMEISHA